MEIDYSILPEHMRDAMRRYIENGEPVGDFLNAILRNDLMDALWVRGRHQLTSPVGIRLFSSQLRASLLLRIARSRGDVAEAGRAQRTRGGKRMNPNSLHDRNQSPPELPECTCVGDMELNNCIKRCRAFPEWNRQWNPERMELSPADGEPETRVIYFPNDDFNAPYFRSKPTAGFEAKHRIIRERDYQRLLNAQSRIP